MCDVAVGELSSSGGLGGETTSGESLLMEESEVWVPSPSCSAMFVYLISSSCICLFWRLLLPPCGPRQLLFLLSPIKSLLDQTLLH